jgi:cytochrome c peroxidase
MHNGMLASLADVVDFYNAGGGENEFSATKTKLIKPLGLNDKEKADLVAFIESLSGDRMVMEQPDLPPSEPLPASSN